MNISGPFSVPRVNAQQQEPDLHLFQRVTAQVLSVTGTTAILSIDGYPIVAQLASADQGATLLPQQTAHFVVTQRTGDKITLKVIGNESPVTRAQSTSQRLEVAGPLLEQLYLPMTDKYLLVTRALLKNHLPVSTVLIIDL